MEQIKTNNPEKKDIYFFNKSFLDDENKCVHLPVQMFKKPGVPDVNIDVDHIESEIHKKYPDVNFTGGWSFLEGEEGIEEYLFFYK